MGKKGGRRSLARPKKRKFYGNQHLSVDVDTGCPVELEKSSESQCAESASSSKLCKLPSLDNLAVGISDESSVTSSSYSDDDTSPCSEAEFSDSEDSDSSCTDLDDRSELAGYRVIHLPSLAKLISVANCCSHCGGVLILEEPRRWGIASQLSLKCGSCAAETSEVMSERQGRFWVVNRRAVLAARAVGLGREGLTREWALMDMPQPLSKTSFQQHQRALLTAACDVAEQSMDLAAATLREKQEEEGSSSPGDVAVTFDGTWMKRGHTSLHGTTTVISWSTGQVLDYEVYSKFCHACSQKKTAVAAGKLSEAEFAAWQEDHVCSATTTGSSGSMEVQGAVDLWQRSADHRQLRYVTFIGDGDSKGHKAVVQNKPYGPDVHVQKEECVGHVQKRVGTRLRELKRKLGNKKLSDDKPIGGIGRLPDRMIDLLQTYFGMAVRNNTGDLQSMARAAWAAITHKVAFDDTAVQHRYCPEGMSSWCGWRRQEAGGEQYVAKDCLPKAVFEVIKPIWLQLTDKALLEKCMRGATQNRNEAWNGMLWGICPKTKFAGSEVVRLCAALTCLRFNNGIISYCAVLEAMGIPCGVFTSSGLAAQDQRRIKEGDRKGPERAKKARKRRRRVKKGLEDDIQAVEGAVYGPGIAD